MALDEEMLQALDALDPTRPAADKGPPATVKPDAQGGPSSSAVFAPSQPPVTGSDKRARYCLTEISDGDRVSPQPTGPGPGPPREHNAHIPTAAEGKSVCKRGGDCVRPGWRAGCKDLAQRLLFNEDLEDPERAQRGPESHQTDLLSAHNHGLPHDKMKTHQRANICRG